MGIHITGPSGAGVTTLGSGLAAALGYELLDTDNYYWLQTDPPYREKRTPQSRVDALARATRTAGGGWVLSGSVGSWGQELIPWFGLVIYLYTAPDVRRERLAEREKRRYGAAIEPGGIRHSDHVAFMEWAAGYEAGDRSGRSKAFHEAWLAELPCPVLRLDGAQPKDALVRRVAQVWKDISAK